MKTALITGITGQDGAYLAKFLLGKGYRVFGLSRSAEPNLSNLGYLGVADKLIVEQCDLMNFEEVKRKILKFNPDEIYNLAGQSSVDYSFREPVETIYYNTNSVLNLLEAIRLFKNNIKFYQATTCEIFSAKNTLPITEESQLFPSSPYGVSKAASHLALVNYRETYGLFCVSGILFNHESHLRQPHYFIRRIIRTAKEISEGKDDYIYLGQADNRRDFGYSPHYVEAMWLMLQNKEPKDYVISSGKSVSIQEIAEYVLKKFNVSAERIRIDKKLFRAPNVPDLYGDSTLARQNLNWHYDMSFFDVLDILIKEEIEEIENKI